MPCCHQDLEQSPIVSQTQTTFLWIVKSPLYHHLCPAKGTLQVADNASTQKLVQTDRNNQKDDFGSTRGHRFDNRRCRTPHKCCKHVGTSQTHFYYCSSSTYLHFNPNDTFLPFVYHLLSNCITCISVWALVQTDLIHLGGFHCNRQHSNTVMERQKQSSRGQRPSLGIDARWSCMRAIDWARTTN